MNTSFISPGCQGTSVEILVRTVKEEEAEISVNLSQVLFRTYGGLALTQCSNLGDVRGTYIGRKGSEGTFGTLEFIVSIQRPHW